MTLAMANTYRADRIAAGLCVRCGERNDRLPLQTCGKCSKGQRIYKRNWDGEKFGGRLPPLPDEVTLPCDDDIPVGPPGFLRCVAVGCKNLVRVSEEYWSWKRDLKMAWCVCPDCASAVEKLERSVSNADDDHKMHAVQVEATGVREDAVRVLQGAGEDLHAVEQGGQAA